jgi:hypothetical protein
MLPLKLFLMKKKEGSEESIGGQDNTNRPTAMMYQYVCPTCGLFDFELIGNADQQTRVRDLIRSGRLLKCVFFLEFVLLITKRQLQQAISVFNRRKQIFATASARCKARAAA